MSNLIKKVVRKIVPESLLEFRRQSIYRYRNNRFKPYLKKRTTEGVTYDFWIGDIDGRDWYDKYSLDPEWLEMRFVKDNMIQKGDVIFECGAHHGCSTLLLANWVGDKGKVIAFEPVPSNCDIVNKNLELNNIKNVTLERKAVGSESKMIRINALSNSMISLTKQGIEVPLVTLNAYESQNPSMLKIDVEGFELEVLRGASNILAKTPKLAIEVHTEQLYKYGASVEELFKLIGAEKYDIWIQRDDSQPPVKYDMKEPILKRVHIFCLPKK
jgi:FkbM family methyltransferase